MPDFYTSVVLLINQSEEIDEKKVSDFDSRGDQSPLMHVAPMNKTPAISAETDEMPQDAASHWYLHSLIS